MRHLLNNLSLAALVMAGALLLGACQEANPVETVARADTEAATTSLAKGGDPGTEVYMAELTPLNDSGVSGKAQFRVKKNGTFVAQVTAVGLAPGQIHAQHIHGFIDPVMESSCPTLAENDTEGPDGPDGIITVGEGAPAYGGILVPLDGSLDVAEGLGDPATFPTADNGGGAVTYRQTISTDDLALNGGATFEDLALDAHAVVLHGAFLNGEYAITLPVACGTITRTN